MVARKLELTHPGKILRRRLAQENTPPDCSGDHAVMAKQVRPWLEKPRMSAAPRVLQSDWEPTSSSHQGQWHKPQKSPNVRVQSDPASPHELEAWQSGGVHVRTLTLKAMV